MATRNKIMISPKLMILLSALLLSACTAIPVKTMYKLATTDPMQVDPQVIRTAARMPNWLKPQPNGAKLFLSMQVENAPKPIKETFILQAIPVSLAQKELSAETKQGFDLYAYRINPDDLPRVQAFRESFKAKKSAGVKVKGSIEASVDACHQGELLEGPILLSNYLRLDNETGYMPVLKDYDLREKVDQKGLEKFLPPC